MANMSLTKNPMPSQDPNVRNKNFDEVALGYTEEQALDEAQRCLNCKTKPCMTGCPVMVHIPEFIAEVAKGNFEQAYQIISHTSALPAVCGLVSARRKASARNIASGAKRVNLWPSAGWSGLLPTGTMPMLPPRLKSLRPTAIGSQLSAPALPV